MTLRQLPELAHVSDLAPRWVRALLRPPRPLPPAVDHCSCEHVAHADGTDYLNWIPGCEVHDAEVMAPRRTR